MICLLNWEDVHRVQCDSGHDRRLLTEMTFLHNDRDEIELWSSEAEYFGGELLRWQMFRKYQEKSQHVARLETELELDNTDSRMINALIRLTDWQEFEAYQGLNVGHALSCQDRRLRDFRWIRKWEARTEPSVVCRVIGDWLDRMNRGQEDLEAAKKVLTWIKGEWPKIVAEVLDSISDTPELQLQLDEKFKKQTHAAFTSILNLGGHPSHAIIPPDESLDKLHRLLYWSTETSKYTEELDNWKLFLTWRQRELGDSPTEQQGYLCPKFESTLAFYAEFESFRRFEYRITLHWLDFRQRVVKWYEDGMEEPGSPAYREEEARSHLRDAEQNLADAATRLERSMQEHAHAFSESGQTVSDEIKKHSSTSRPPPTPPPSCSESPSSQCSSSPHSCSSKQIYPSPPSSQASQLSQSYGRLSGNRTPPSKSNATEKLYRLLKEAARKGGPRSDNNDRTQQTLPIFSPGSSQIEEEDDVHMVDDLEVPKPAEAKEESERPEFDDTVMADLETSSSDTPLCLSKFFSRPISKYEAWKIRFFHRNPSLRKTLSPTKLDQAPSGGVTKPTGKKPAKKVTKFTEQQTMMLLNAASNSDCPTDSLSPRINEWLKENAAASAILSQSQLNATQTPQSLDHKQPQKQAGHIEPARPSKRKISETSLDTLEPPQTPRRKKPKIQLDTLEPPQTLGHEKPKVQHDTLEQPQTSRHEKPKVQFDTLESPQTSGHKKRKVQHDELELPQTPRRKKPKIQHDALEPPQTSGQKKRKIQHDKLEPLQTSEHKNSKIQHDTLERPQPSSEHKNLKTQYNTLESPQTSEHKKRKVQHDELEPPETPRRKKPKIQPDAPDPPQKLKLRKPKMGSKADKPSRRQKFLEKRVPTQRSRVDDIRNYASE